jgi:hypothetical protein
MARFYRRTGIVGNDVSRARELMAAKKKTPASGAGAKSTFEGREEKTLRMNATDSQP